jgi:hypothetical protein
MIEAIKAAIPKGPAGKIDDRTGVLLPCLRRVAPFVGQCLSPNDGDVML